MREGCGRIPTALFWVGVRCFRLFFASAYQGRAAAEGAEQAEQAQAEGAGGGYGNAGGEGDDGGVAGGDGVGNLAAVLAAVGILHVVKGVAGLVGVGDGYPALGFAVAVSLPLVAGGADGSADFDAEGVGCAVVDGGGGGAGGVDLPGVGDGEGAVVAYGYGAYHFNRCVAGSVADVVGDGVFAGAAVGLDGVAGNQDVAADVAVDVVVGGGAWVYVVGAAVDFNGGVAEQGDEGGGAVGYDVDGAYDITGGVACAVGDVVGHLEAGAGGVGVGGAGHADFCGEVALAAVGGAVAGVAPGLANEGVGRGAAFKSDDGRDVVLDVDDALFLDGGAEAVGDFVGDGVAPGGGGVDGVDAGGGEGAGEVAVFCVAGGCSCVGVGAAAAFEGDGGWRR